MKKLKRSESIKIYLDNVARPDLAKLYHAGMEVQVNVVQCEDGEPVEERHKGGSPTWTNGTERWYNYRIPRNSWTEPEDNDFDVQFSVEARASHIGMTGWDWKEKCSRWVAFDFDHISGHSEKHTKKLTTEEMEEVTESAKSISWVTVRRSTSGRGLHLYVFFDPSVPGIKTHTEHAALARAVLGKMSALTGHHFTAKVDAQGGNVWVWSTHQDPDTGFMLVKEGGTMRPNEIPVNWRDHIDVVRGKRRRSAVGFISAKTSDKFEDLASQWPKTELTDEHKRLTGYLERRKAQWWFDQDRHMLVCHTFDLKEAHRELDLKGIFDTLAEGSTGAAGGADHNCFCYPLEKGGWSVFRYTPGIEEAPTWTQNLGGWTFCNLNVDPDLETAARAHGGVEGEYGDWSFHQALDAVSAADLLGVKINLPRWAESRQAFLKANKAGKLVFDFTKEKDDQQEAGWAKKGRKWQRVQQAQVQLVARKLKQPFNYDDLIRHIKSGNKGSGWVLNIRGVWNDEPPSNVKYALKSEGFNTEHADAFMGLAVLSGWDLIVEPFQPEYPGERVWNRNAPQFRVAPSQKDELNFPHWQMILDHLGHGIDAEVKEDKWCRSNHILTGADYLMCWIVSMIQEPERHLPYLFFFSGPQDCGKSILHEAMHDYIFDQGYVLAEGALQNNFNGELSGAILCVIEEKVLKSRDPKEIYNRIKTVINARFISLHEKFKNPIMVENKMHWMQCANEGTACPQFDGDTRITVIRVNPLEKNEKIGRNRMNEALKREAPDFIRAIQDFPLPTPPLDGRLGIPVIETEAKEQLQKANQSTLVTFIRDNTYHVAGSKILYKDFRARFMDYLDVHERPDWTKQLMRKELPSEFPIGRWYKEDGGPMYLCNISWDFAEPGKRLFVKKDKIYEAEE